MTYPRLAGLMYLVVLVLDIAGSVIVSAVGGSGGFGDVSHRIAASEVLYRLGLCLGLAGSLSTVLLAVALYLTVKPFDANLALVALLFRSAEAAIGGMGVAFAFSTLQIYLARSGGLDAGQLGALAGIASGDASTQVAAIFFSLGSTVFFYLFWRSGYIPRLMAGWGVFASAMYAVAWFVSLVVPQGSGIVIGVASAPILIAEVSTGLWLLIRGISLREAPQPSMPRSAPAS